MKKRLYVDLNFQGDSFFNKMARISIILPAQNEETQIAACLVSLTPFFNAGDRIIVVDACSSDQTSAIVRDFGMPVISASTPARGGAIGLGIEYFKQTKIQFDLFLIAHADMRFPADARDQLLASLHAYPNRAWGAFGHRIDNPRLLLRIVERGNNFRARWFQMPYGDQGQFFKPEILETIGGFPPLAFMEDYELSRRLKQHSRMLYLDHPITIPSRHWDRGIFRATWKNWKTILYYKFWGTLPR
ncbi:glycosyltransferase [bacterium]|nr:glycosyltransferase [bacterium]